MIVGSIRAETLIDRGDLEVSGEGGDEDAAAKMLKAISEATTIDRLVMIDKNRRLGFAAERLSKRQSGEIRTAIDKKLVEIRASIRQRWA